MEAVFDHIRDNVVVYGVVSVLLIPVLYAFRQFTGPFLFHTLETIIYAIVFHLVFAGAVRFLSYFKNATSIDRAYGGDVDLVGYTTPLQDFWKQELYYPRWLFYVEVAALLGIIGIVVYFRPMSMKGVNRYKGKDAEDAKRPARYAKGKPTRGQMRRTTQYSRGTGRRR